MQDKTYANHNLIQQSGVQPRWES